MLSLAQYRQVKKQFQVHQHGKLTVRLTFGTVLLDDFVIYPDVFRADIMASSHVLGGFLADNPDLYRGKCVLDMGCGSGVLGIIMMLSGARDVVFSDRSPDSVLNTGDNTMRVRTTGKLSRLYGVFCGDLFEHLRFIHDIIVFNHPFFPGRPKYWMPASFAMLDEGELLQRFLREAPRHLANDGSIIMPFLHMAGDTNDPAVHAPAHGYKVEEVFATTLTEGIQQGPFSIYLLHVR